MRVSSPKAGVESQIIVSISRYNLSSALLIDTVEPLWCQVRSHVQVLGEAGGANGMTRNLLVEGRRCGVWLVGQMRWPGIH